MKNLFKKLVIASACISMAVTAIPVNNSMTSPVTVQAAEKSGLYHEGKSWNYYKDGAIATDTTTLVKYNNSWWYVKDGKIDFTTTTLVKFNGKWFYVRNGKVDFSTTTVFKKDGVWWYIHNGEVDFSVRTLCKYNGTWWYVNNGKIDWHTDTVVRYGNAWYHVKNGQVDWKSETLVKYNNEWWYVKGGTIRFGATTLCRYNGTWWYVHNGKLDFNSGELLVPYNSHIWYVKDGKMQDYKGTPETTAMPCNGKWYIIHSLSNRVYFFEDYTDFGNQGRLPYNGVIGVGGRLYWAVNSTIDFSIGSTPEPSDEERQAAIDSGNPFVEASPTWKYHEQYVEQCKLCNKKVKEYKYISK